MNVLDRARILGATMSYDLWLDFAGVPGRRRRNLRRELRANLGDATAFIGSREAVRGLGSTRTMAAAANAPDPTRPRWTVGFTVGMSIFALSIMGQFFAALSWVDGVMAAAPETIVTGAMTFYPGSSLTYDPSGSGFSVAIDFGWICLLIGCTAFALAAQPWRLLRQQRKAPSQ
jgi:hypothetical protein